MNIFEKLKNLFKKDKTLQLPEGSNYNTKSNFKKSLKFLKEPISPVENDISAYLNSYYDLLANYEAYHIYPDSYSALTRINSEYGYSNGNNVYYENSLLNNLYNNGYRCQTQSCYGEACFYHIKSPNYKLPNFDKMIRLYINCKNDNVSELAGNILQINNDPNFYLKFYGSQLIDKRPRSEKIVIYTDEQSLNNTVHNLETLKAYRPDLFEGSEKTCAFMPKVNDFISYAPQPNSDSYYDLNNNEYKIAQSANKFISTALEESFISSVNDLAYATDPQLYNYLNTPNGEDIKFKYVKQIPYLNQNYHDYLIKNMTTKLQILSGKNNLNIKNLEPIRQIENNTVQFDVVR